MVCHFYCSPQRKDHSIELVDALSFSKGDRDEFGFGFLTKAVEG